jgi:hypothetical protein
MVEKESICYRGSDMVLERVDNGVSVSCNSFDVVVEVDFEEGVAYVSDTDLDSEGVEKIKGALQRYFEDHVVYE